MADFDWGKLIGAGVQAGSSYAGSQQAIDAQKQQQEILKAAYQRALDMIESGELQYNAQQVPGILRPGGDVRAKLAQNDALARLQEAAREGYNVVDQAAINRAINEANANANSQTEGALARLDPNSGAAAAARMGAQQSAANRVSQQALDVAAASRRHALDALGAYGNFAGKMRDQEFGEASGIDRFNADVARWNAGAKNQAAQQGISNKLAAFGAGTGAGSNYADAVAKGGVMSGAQTAGLGSSAAGMFNAFGSGGNRSDNTGGDRGTAETYGAYQWTPAGETTSYTAWDEDE